MNYPKFITSVITAVVIALFSFSWKQAYQVDEEYFVYHTVDPKQKKIALYWKTEEGQRIGSLSNLRKELERQGKTLKFAMNGGMYLKDGSPQGLFIQEGKTIKKVNNVQDAYGNFYMQPNGVFYITKNGEAKVTTTARFKNNGSVLYATQSGPMLLIDGDYHPKFRKGSSNLHIRNGVGVLPNGQLLFAMSKEEVNFYDLATFFKQQGCQNALYLDGFVSRTYLPSKDWVDLDGNFGVMIGEIE